VEVRLSEEQELLRQSVRDFVARECPLARVRELAERDLPFPADLWRAMAELGWLGLDLPAACGGLGLGAVEVAVVAEELGRGLVPAPFLASAVLASGAVALAGSDAQRRALLPSFADGSRVGTLVLDGAGGPDGITARSTAHGLRLEGTASFALDADAAHLLVVAARGPDTGTTLALVERAAPGVLLRRIGWLDLTRRVFEVTLDGVDVGAETVLDRPGRGGPLLERLLDRARAALAAEMAGGAARVLEMSVAFASTRQQFGRPIGSFQAVQHTCADMLVRAEGARSAALHAAWAVAVGEPDAHVAACLAKAWCSEAYSSVAGDGIQVHGGLGYTWEQDLHLFYKRATADELLCGDAAAHRELAAAAAWGRPST
jgi:alkylation response protein AidB-like acyl-CoA dehydrogenase